MAGQKIPSSAQWTTLIPWPPELLLIQHAYLADEGGVYGFVLQPDLATAALRFSGGVLGIDDATTTSAVQMVAVPPDLVLIY
jgi:hypothetical protein